MDYVQIHDGKEPARNRCYTVKEIAAILGISSTSAYELVKKFSSVRIGAAIRISRSSFDQWLEQNEM